MIHHKHIWNRSLNELDSINDDEYDRNTINVKTMTIQNTISPLMKRRKNFVRNISFDNTDGLQLYGTVSFLRQDTQQQKRLLHRKSHASFSISSIISSDYRRDIQQHQQQQQQQQQQQIHSNPSIRQLKFKNFSFVRTTLLLLLSCILQYSVPASLLHLVSSYVIPSSPSLSFTARITTTTTSINCQNVRYISGRFRVSMPVPSKDRILNHYFVGYSSYHRLCHQQQQQQQQIVSNTIFGKDKTSLQTRKYDTRLRATRRIVRRRDRTVLMPTSPLLRWQPFRKSTTTSSKDSYLQATGFGTSGDELNNIQIAAAAGSLIANLRPIETLVLGVAGVIGVVSLIGAVVYSAQNKELQYQLNSKLVDTTTKQRQLLELTQTTNVRTNTNTNETSTTTGNSVPTVNGDLFEPRNRKKKTLLRTASLVSGVAVGSFILGSVFLLPPLEQSMATTPEQQQQQQQQQYQPFSRTTMPTTTIASTSVSYDTNNNNNNDNIVSSQQQQFGLLNPTQLYLKGLEFGQIFNNNPIQVSDTINKIMKDTSPGDYRTSSTGSSGIRTDNVVLLPSIPSPDFDSWFIQARDERKALRSSNKVDDDKGLISMIPSVQLPNRNAAVQAAVSTANDIRSTNDNTINKYYDKDNDERGLIEKIPVISFRDINSVVGAAVTAATTTLPTSVTLATTSPVVNTVTTAATPPVTTNAIALTAPSLVTQDVGKSSSSSSLSSLSPTPVAVDNSKSSIESTQQMPKQLQEQVPNIDSTQVSTNIVSTKSIPGVKVEDLSSSISSTSTPISSSSIQSPAKTIDNNKVDIVPDLASKVNTGIPESGSSSLSQPLQLSTVQPNPLVDANVHTVKLLVDGSAQSSTKDIIPSPLQQQQQPPPPKPTTTLLPIPDENNKVKRDMDVTMIENSQAVVKSQSTPKMLIPESIPATAMTATGYSISTFSPISASSGVGTITAIPIPKIATVSIAEDIAKTAILPTTSSENDATKEGTTVKKEVEEVKQKGDEKSKSTEDASIKKDVENSKKTEDAAVKQDVNKMKETEDKIQQERKKEIDGKKQTDDVKQEAETKNPKDADTKQEEVAKKEIDSQKQQLETKNKDDVTKKEQEDAKKKVEIVDQETDAKKYEETTKKETDVKKQEEERKTTNDNAKTEAEAVKLNEEQARKQPEEAKAKGEETKKTTEVGKVREEENKKKEDEAKKLEEANKKIEAETMNKEIEVKKQVDETNQKETGNKSAEEAKKTNEDVVRKDTAESIEKEAKPKQLEEANTKAIESKQNSEIAATVATAKTEVIKKNEDAPQPKRSDDPNTRDGTSETKKPSVSNANADEGMKLKIDGNIKEEPANKKPAETIQNKQEGEKVKTEEQPKKLTEGTSKQGDAIKKDEKLNPVDNVSKKGEEAKQQTAGKKPAEEKSNVEEEAKKKDDEAKKQAESRKKEEEKTKMEEQFKKDEEIKKQAEAKLKEEEAKKNAEAKKKLEEEKKKDEEDKKRKETEKQATAKKLADAQKLEEEKSSTSIDRELSVPSSFSAAKLSVSPGVGIAAAGIALGVASVVSTIKDAQKQKEKGPQYQRPYQNTSSLLKVPTELAREQQRQMYLPPPPRQANRYNDGYRYNNFDIDERDRRFDQSNEFERFRPNRNDDYRRQRPRSSNDGLFWTRPLGPAQSNERRQVLFDAQIDRYPGRRSRYNGFNFDIRSLEDVYMPSNLPMRNYRPPYINLNDRNNFRQPRYDDRLRDGYMAPNLPMRNYGPLYDRYNFRQERPDDRSRVNGYMPPNLPSRNYGSEYDMYGGRYRSREPTYYDDSLNNRYREDGYNPSIVPTRNYGNEYNREDQNPNTYPNYDESNFDTQHRDDGFSPRNSVSSESGGAPWYAPGNSFTNYFNLDRNENRRDTARQPREYGSTPTNENSGNNNDNYNNGRQPSRTDVNGWYSNNPSQNRGLNGDDNRQQEFTNSYAPSQSPTTSDDIGWDSVATNRRGDFNDRRNGFRSADVRDVTVSFEADPEPWYSTSNFKRNAFDVSVSKPLSDDRSSQRSIDEKNDINNDTSQQSQSYPRMPTDPRDDERRIDTYERLKNYDDSRLNDNYSGQYSSNRSPGKTSPSNVRKRDKQGVGQSTDPKSDHDHDDLSYDDRMNLLQELDAKISKAIFLSKNIDDLISGSENDDESQKLTEN